MAGRAAGAGSLIPHPVPPRPRPPSRPAAPRPVLPAPPPQDKPGLKLGVVGLGGLGHMAVKLGFGELMLLAARRAQQPMCTPYSASTLTCMLIRGQLLPHPPKPTLHCTAPPPHPHTHTHHHHHHTLHTLQVTVISRSPAKREEACRPDCLGADHFLVSREQGEMAGAAGTLDGIIDTLAGGLALVSMRESEVECGVSPRREGERGLGT